jgi:hypothetical protein
VEVAYDEVEPHAKATQPPTPINRLEPSLEAKWQ